MGVLLAYRWFSERSKTVVAEEIVRYHCTLFELAAPCHAFGGIFSSIVLIYSPNSISDDRPMSRF